MAEKKEKLQIQELNKFLKDSSVHSRHKELARRQAMTWKNRLTDEELEQMLHHESFVENMMKEYMHKELLEIEKLIYDIEDESDRKEKGWKVETLLGNLKDLLPDLIKMME